MKILSKNMAKVGISVSNLVKNHRASIVHHGTGKMLCSTVESALETQGKEEHRHIELMSLDVEGHELPVLKGINWERTTIDVVITEGKSRQVINLLKEKGYDHYPNIHKDHIWIRTGSGLRIDQRAVSHGSNRTT